MFVVCTSFLCAQSLSLFSTVSTSVTSTPGFCDGTPLYERTIGFGPNMSLSCYEAIGTYGLKKGYVSVCKDAQSIYVHQLTSNIFIRDMVRHNYSDTVFFCGMRKSQTDDSVGVLGFFVVKSTGTIPHIYFSEVPGVDILTDLVVVGQDSGYVISALGAKIDSTATTYYMVNGMFPPISYSVVHYLTPLTHNSTPVDIIATDDFVAILSRNEVANTYHIRRFDRNNFLDSQRDDVFTYQFSGINVFDIVATFKGDEMSRDGENEIAISYIYLDYNQWYAKVCTIDLQTMTMTTAQKLKLVEKNTLYGITYLTAPKRLAVLLDEEPNLQYYNSTAVMFVPDNSTGYTSEDYFGGNMDDCRTISRIHENSTMASYFLCSCVSSGGCHLLAHDASCTDLSSDYCLKRKDVYIEVVDQTSPDEETDVLNTNYVFTTIYGNSLTNDSLIITPCSTSNR